jgi:hypothetical protein
LFNAKQLRPQGQFSRALAPHPCPCRWDFRARRLHQHHVIIRCSAAVIPKFIFPALLHAHHTRSRSVRVKSGVIPLWVNPASLFLTLRGWRSTASAHQVQRFPALTMQFVAFFNAHDENALAVFTARCDNTISSASSESFERKSTRSVSTVDQDSISSASLLYRARARSPPISL